ncbi:LamG-like jellyroll fold domain-containing protein [Niveispirillum sp. KHB5.9]|uniref:LamG-like jellyroll fold domain-containing protein n=1 Tax=Niveispirillum sp. KHB5.9 TaxID=3400269 RepID=UPI003A8C754C
MARAMRLRTGAAALALLVGALPAVAADGLLFQVTGDKGLVADKATGQASPTFADKVAVVPQGGAAGAYLQAADDQVLAWAAPGNIRAQRGTLSFFWRSRYPVGSNQFPLFRVSFANHSSWDMVFLRLDWNGKGFDGFVTDTNLSRVRVSWAMPTPPAPDAWTHIAFAWDEATGVQLYVNGALVARKDQPASLDASLDQLGPHSRIISPIQVQSRYNFLRGGDIDDIRVHDRALDAAGVKELAQGREPVSLPAAPDGWAAWAHRNGFDRADDPPPYLADASTRIRKVEFTEQRDIAQRMWKGNDGVRETTWPGVYNRSRLEGRHDYFTLPDWNVYSTGGKSGTWFLPDEPFNQVEIQGAAFGKLGWLQGAKLPEGNGLITGDGDLLSKRRQGIERSTTRLKADATGGALRFVNEVQETPIQEIGAYHVGPGTAPAGLGDFHFNLRLAAEPDFTAIRPLRRFIDGRYPEGERDLIVAIPDGGVPTRKRTKSPVAGRPVAHIAIPMDFRRQEPGLPLYRASTEGFENIGGLDGIELVIPALDVNPTHKGGLVALNIRVKDPLTPERDLLDINVAVKPGEARTLWLDTRDRILPSDRPLYMSIAASAPDFSVAKLDGASLRLVFKPKAEARPEHAFDRERQIQDNYGFLVEERQSSRNLGLFQRFYEDVADLLRIDPDNKVANAYWSEWNPQQPLPPVELDKAPAGVPEWAWGQTKYLAQVRSFVNWWIDHRQVDGEFGGGLSDDTDLTNQWPGLALMGADREKLTTSLADMIEAVHVNGMMTNGLGTIVTDELHVYEEGINAQSQMSLLSPGDPLVVERLMETAANFPDLLQVNPKGHRLLVSNYFGAGHIVKEAPWQWSKPYSYLIFHPGIRLVEINGDAATRKLLLELADGYLAHGKQGSDGAWTFPTEINWPDGATRGTSGPEQTNLLMWAAYRWTGRPEYLRPIEQVLRKGGLPSLSGIVGSDLALDLNRPDLRNAVLEAAKTDRYAGPYSWHTAWVATGDKQWLVKQYDSQRQTAALRMDMMTGDHWWTDRVELPTQELQRQRLGGVALYRNSIVRGNRIAWRFADPDGAEKLAILVKEPTRTGFRVLAHNLSDQPLSATIIGADVATGDWKVTEGVDTDGDDGADAGTSSTRQVAFGEGQGVPVTLAPGRTTVLDFALAGPEQDLTKRPDAAIAARDVTVAKGKVAVKVHNIGSVPTPKGRVRLLAADGSVLAEVPLPAIPAPLDLKPKTAEVTLKAPIGLSSVDVVLEGGVAEPWSDNNKVVLR